MSGLDLEPSKLGTKEHWDNVYKDEIVNFEEIGDEGEIWHYNFLFGVESVDKMVSWTAEHVPPSSDPSILEVGSGNGTLILALLEEDYPARNLAGIDYSEDAVKLSKLVAAAKDGDEVTFNMCDFLTEDPPRLSHMDPSKTDVWDLLLDKGTYDAIALGGKDEHGNSPAARYPARAARLIKPGGFFLITCGPPYCIVSTPLPTIIVQLATLPKTSSKQASYQRKPDFSISALFALLPISIIQTVHVHTSSRIKHPSFTFGGKSGNVYCSVAFKKT
ncbi:Protein-lysine N-methyltransferase efm4 [Marasmius crinis-equi]|uniref:Protein-lysine N-methyltransferase EFM4 n=1 Tax=Marasmius crinis-equi TaxID=585013 RepID=A0ABR3FHY5_9AGAR